MCHPKLITINGMEFSSPKAQVHLLGPQTYKQILKDNKFFLTTVATVPINLEYHAWFAVINSANESETDPTLLYDHLLRKMWFLQIEEVDCCKCLIVMTKPNLLEACTWMDNNLEPLIRQLIPEGIDPPTSQLPCQLNKPVYSASSQSYANVLKKQFSLAPNMTMSTTDNTHPPQKWQAANIIDYDLDTSTNAPSTNTAVTTSTTNQCTLQPTKAMTHNHDHATKLQSIRMEINALKTMISDAVAQFKTTIASITAPRSQSSDMDTDAEDPQEHNNNNQKPNDLEALIQDIKYKIATIITETRALFEQQLLLVSHNKCPSPNVT